MASGSILTQNQYDGKKNLCSLIRDACSVYACLHVYITIYLCKSKGSIPSLTPSPPSLSPSLFPRFCSHCQGFSSGRYGGDRHRRLFEDHRTGTCGPGPDGERPRETTSKVLRQPQRK